MCFNDTSQESNYPITIWEWTINNGIFTNSNNTTQNPCFLFDSCSINQQVTLTVTDALGCEDDTVVYVDVYCNPSSIINNISTVCQGNATTFTNSSQIGSAPINNYLWNFGDNNTSIGSNASHIYDPCGNYNATLEITDTNNCVNYDTLIIIVNCEIGSLLICCIQLVCAEAS
jgi:PKD repeat protein